MVAVPTRKRSGSAWLVVAGGVLIGLAPFAPWISFGSFAPATSGIDYSTGSAVGSVVLGIVTVLIGFSLAGIATLPRWMQRSGLVTGVWAAVATGIDTATIMEYIRDVDAEVGVTVGALGFGVYLSFVGAAAAIIGTLGVRFEQGETLADQARRVAYGLPAADHETSARKTLPATRQCPACLTEMPRAAATCPACGHNSPAWVFHQGRWWIERAAGEWFWLDEQAHRWVAATMK